MSTYSFSHMKQKFLIICLVLISTSVCGQEVTNQTQSLPNTLFIEALGNGILGSVNYERRLFKKPNLTARIGIGFHAESTIYLSTPVSIQYLIDLKKSSFIEAGVGYTWAQYGADDCFHCDGSDNTENYNNLFLSVGYRKHFGRNWMWKANFSPLIVNNHDENFRPWIGVSFGKQF